MPSLANAAFLRNRDDVKELWNIHGKAAGKGKGRKHRVEILNRTVIVFLCACWESYIEDVLRCAIDAELAAAAVPAPQAVRLRLPLECALSRFHTPDSRGVKALLADVLGLKDIVKHWKVPGRPVLDDSGNKRSIANRLDDLVRLRGRIAHRVSAASSVSKGDGESALALIENLVRTTDVAVGEHMTHRMGIAPW